MWECLKNILSDEKSPNTFGLQQNNSYITNPSKVAEAFNKHFSTIGKKLAQAFSKVKALIIAPRTTASFTIKTGPVEFVKLQLQNLKADKAVGLDKISGGF